jgi:hypothetical protein
MALVLVLLFLFVLVASLAAGFAVNVGERRIDDGSRQSSQAMAMAETGLQRMFEDRAALGLTAIPPAAAESVRVAMSGGFADLIVTRIRPAVGAQAALYVVRSHAVRTQTATGAEPNAEQTVTEYATWNVGTMRVQSGLTSLSGITKTGASGTISGVDECGAKPTLPAVSVPGTPGYTGSLVPLTGTPPVDTSLGHTGAQMAANVPVNWPGIVNGTALTPDVVIPPGPWPTSTKFADPNYWPTIRVDNRGGASFTLPGAGRGLLIVTGDLVVTGSNMWQGVVLVGSTLTSDGNNSVEGATVVGLNVMLGDAVPTNSVGNGTKFFQYNSCYVTNAMQGQGRFRPMSNTWLTKWPTY